MTGDASDHALAANAIGVRDKAYAPHSGFKVGAALLDDKGAIHTGCNVENASYPEGSCAETGAIAAMVASGGRRIRVIAIAGGENDITLCPPCGGCRQRILEFADENTRVLLLESKTKWQTYTLAELLPISFHL